MKRKLLLSALLLISSAPIIAQEVSNTTTKTMTPAPTNTSNPIIKPVLTEAQTIDRKIATVDAKLAYYSSHPDEKKIAESDGTIAALNQQRSELVLQKNTAPTSEKTVKEVSEPIDAKPVEMKPVGNQTETVEHLNSVIFAIDSKVAYIKSDQTENQHAIESGWYDKMAKQRANLVVKRDNLLKEQTTK